MSSEGGSGLSLDTSACLDELDELDSGRVRGSGSGSEWLSRRRDTWGRRMGSGRLGTSPVERIRRRASYSTADMMVVDDQVRRAAGIENGQFGWTRVEHKPSLRLG